MTTGALALTLAALGLAFVAPWALPATARIRTPGPADAPPADVHRAHGVGSLGPAVLLDLVATAVAAGASVPRALAAVGWAVGGADGADLRRAAGALELGAPWSAAWGTRRRGALAVRDALGPSWTTGSAPGPALRVGAEQLRRERTRLARTAAGRLSAQIVLPLGLCYLPAFVLLGLVPVLLSLAGGLVNP